MTAELTELTELHMAYEAIETTELDLGEAGTALGAADDLSRSVAAFLAARGYASCDPSTPTLSLRDRLALLLSDFDANGLQPTNAALDVILAVVQSTELTESEWTSTGAPTAYRVALDAERFLNAKRREWASA